MSIVKLGTKKLVSQKANHKEINKISNVNLKQLDTNKLKSTKNLFLNHYMNFFYLLYIFTVMVDGIEIENVKSLQVSSSFGKKCLHLNLIVS